MNRLLKSPLEEEVEEVTKSDQIERNKTSNHPPKSLLNCRTCCDAFSESRSIYSGHRSRLKKCPLQDSYLTKNKLEKKNKSSTVSPLFQ